MTGPSRTSSASPATGSPNPRTGSRAWMSPVSSSRWGPPSPDSSQVTRCSASPMGRSPSSPRASENNLVAKPSQLSFEEAAVVPVSAVTALKALVDVGGVEAGQRVLVVGASGGVGTYAVQLAKALGADVTGVASTSKLEMVRSLGADHVIDYTTTDFADGDHAYDLVLDIGGRSGIARLRRALTKNGTLVIVGGEDGNRFTGGIGRQLRAVALSPFVSQRLTTFIATVHHTLIERLAEFIAARPGHTLGRPTVRARGAFPRPCANSPPAGQRQDRHHRSPCRPELMTSLSAVAHSEFETTFILVALLAALAGGGRTARRRTSLTPTERKEP